jgi:protoporphyrinogen/coproporphyrinogen III oxidase
MSTESVEQTVAVQPQRHVVIVGGGIAGLAAAYELQCQARDANITFTVLEASASTGGKLITDRADGFVIEGGPDSFLSQKPWAAALCRKLGLGDDLIGTNDDERKTYILVDGRLVVMPEGLQLIIPTRLVPFLRSPLLSWRGKLRMLLDLVLPRGSSVGDESIMEFVGRRMGREVVEKLAEPLLCGIHAARPEQQSVATTFARFRDLERQHRSLILGSWRQRRAAPPVTGRGPSAFQSLRGGVRQLVEALETALGDRIVTDARVATVEREGDGYRVLLEDGRGFEGDAVIVATPTYVAGTVTADINPALAAMLKAIRYVSTASIYLGYRQADVGGRLPGFGFVIPRGEQRRIFGSTWASSKFDGRAPEGNVLLRCFVGGAEHEERVDWSDAELIRAAREELADIMGLRAEPVITRVFRWHKANPQYDVGHAERVEAIYRACAASPGLFVTGGAYEGVGVPDCVRHGEATARRVLQFLGASVATPAR